MSLSSLLLVLLSAGIHASWNFFTKKSIANKIVILWFSWFIAGLVMTPISLLTIDIKSVSISWIPYIALTTIIHVAYIYLLGWAYSIGDMSLIYPIARGIGVMLTVLIVTFAGIEQISETGVIGIVILVIGIILIGIKRFSDLDKRKAMKIAALVGACTSLYTIIDKISIAHIPPLFYISVMFLCTSVVLLPLMIYKFRSHSINVRRQHKLYCSMIGFASLFGYLLILYAMQEAPTPYVAALREIAIVFGTLLGIKVLKEEANKRKIIGIITIIIGAIIIKIA